MKRALREQWQTVPAYIRKPVVFIVGIFFFVAAILTGWLPGPGGIPLFLVGIAVLSTEFAWAKKVKDIVMNIIHACARWYRRHRTLGMILLTGCAAIGSVVLFIMIRQVFLK